MCIYRLVTFGEEVQITLYVAPSKDKHTALRELKEWAFQHHHTIATSPNDEETTCMLQILEEIKQ